MNRVILQFWEETNKNKGIVPNGCSLHADSTERNKYISRIYKNRGDEIPEKYDRIIGEEQTVYICDEIYEKIGKRNSIKLSETAYQNLVNFEDIIFKTN